ncbi:hypothetical protein [Caenimonas koreensis]|uniref:hypothetical protein n=1 Tax=Caenimonas koreensis TaxID=367474 RepID=UPI00378401D7
MTGKRAFRLAAVVAVFMACASASAADSCSTLVGRKKINIVVPFKPGGGYDSYARVLAPVLQDITGARVAVSNIAGANGVSGMKAIASAPVDSITLGVFDLRDLLAARLTDATLPPIADFTAIGAFGETNGVWASREDGVRLLAGNQPLAAGVSTGVVSRILLPAMLLDREIKLVRGYSGSADRWLALLRGDVDLTDGSLDSVQRFVSSAPGTRVLMVLSDGPFAELPGVPHLAGPGGLVDLHTRKLDPKVRRERMELASLAADLAQTSRAVAIARTAPAPVRACIEAAVEQALFSATLRDAAKLQKLVVEPMRGAVVREHLVRIERSMMKHQAVLKRLAAAS